MYEFIEGGDLTGLVHERQAQGRLTPEFATQIIHRLASIVAIVHRLDPPLVHRDLKLSNVLVRRGDCDLLDLFVADFGIGGLVASQAFREQTGRRGANCQLLPTALRGSYTPLYASPQQVKGERPDPRDDVHALGVIWYQLVTGDVRLLSIPPDWQEVVGDRGLGKELVQMMALCLASRFEKRLVDATALVERLAGYLAGVRFDPRNTICYTTRGRAWLAKKDYDRAIKDFNEAVYLDPKCASAYHYRGRVWYAKQDDDLAIKDFDQAIRLDLKDMFAYYYRGMAWYAKKDYEKANQDFNEVLRLLPNGRAAS
jgi:serine/threonine protein kinase